LLEIPDEKENTWRKYSYKFMYICAQCGEDFSYVVLLVTLNAYILFTESFLGITFTNKLLYEFWSWPDRTGWNKSVRFQLCIGLFCVTWIVFFSLNPVYKNFGNHPNLRLMI
jgi:hypothetical protein